MSEGARDTALTLGLVVTFAVLVTVHVATLFGLIRRRQLLAALGSALLPPLAPWCAFSRGMRLRAVLWLASAALYAVTFVLASMASSPH